MKVLSLLSLLLVTSCIFVDADYKKRKECHFPFNYKGQVYNDCITSDARAPWCSASKVYSGMFFYCNDGEGYTDNSDSGFIMAQYKLMENAKLLANRSFEIGKSCTQCSADLMIFQNSVKQTVKISDDNDRQINFLMDVENTKFRDSLRSNLVDVMSYLNCPDGWEKMNGEECYTIIRGKNLAEGKALCAKHNANVLTVKDAKENEFIRSKAAAMLGKNSGILIGFNDLKNEGKFVWDDKDETKYSNWKKGEPNNVSNEDCTMVFLTSGQWNDVKCSVRSNVVCRGHIVTTI